MSSAESAGRARPVLAIVTDAVHPYSRGGREVRYHELTRRLTDHYDVHVYTMQWWSGARTMVTDGVTYHAITPLLPLYVGSKRSLSQAIWFALACLRMLFYHFDVIEADHIPFLQVLVLRAVATVKRKRFVATWHEVWDLTYWRRYMGGRIGVLAWLVEVFAMHLPDHIFAASPQTADRLRAYLSDRHKVTVVPNGIDLDTVATAYPAASGTDLIVVGRLMPHKRVDMLLQVVAQLHAEGLPVTCRVIGIGPQQEELHRLAKDLGIAGAVDFCHDVTEHKDLYGMLKAARVGVFPSSREGFGIAVLEALAAGLPVVTTSTPDNLAQYLVAHATRGVVCKPSVPALAAAVRKVLAEDNTGPGKPDPWVGEYDWDAMAERIAEAVAS